MQPALFRDWRSTLSLQQREVQPAAGVVAEGQAEAQAAGDAGLLDVVINRTRYTRADRDLATASTALPK